MIGVEDEVNKHRTCKDRNELERLIRGYKDLALQHATNLIVAGQYTTVAHKLQEICDRLPAPHLRSVTAGNRQDAQVKTAAITNEENARISSAWEQRTGSSHGGTKH